MKKDTFLSHLLVYIFAILVLIAGCDSDDVSGWTPTDPNTDFSLFAPGFFTAGYTITFNLTGTLESAGHESSCAGILSYEAQPQSTFLGQDAIPVLSLAKICDMWNISETAYYSIEATDRHLLGYEWTVSATTVAIPQTARIGDSSYIGTYYNYIELDDAGTIASESWSLADAGNGRAYLERVYRLESVGIFTFLRRIITTTTTIDPSGNPVAVKYVLYNDRTGDTFTLTGSLQ